MSEVLFLKDLSNIDFKCIKLLGEFISEPLSPNTLNEFKSIKNNIDSWKKGSLISNDKKINKSNLDISKENLSLYLNQLSHTNYDIISNKINIELDNNIENRELFLDIFIKSFLFYDNNLDLYLKLFNKFNIIADCIKKIQIKINEYDLKIMNRNDYIQLCKDNKSNIIYKNMFKILGKIYITSEFISDTEMSNYIQILHDEIITFTDINILEKTLEIYVDLIKIIYSKIPNLDNLIIELITWKEDKQKFSNRPRFKIMDLLDYLQKK